MLSFCENESAPRNTVHNCNADLCEMCFAVARAEIICKVFCAKIKLWHIFGSVAS